MSLRVQIPACRRLRVSIEGAAPAFTFDRKYIEQLVYHTEEIRGYESRGDMWSPGYFHVQLSRRTGRELVASTESWDTIRAMSRERGASAPKLERRRSLIAARAPASAQEGFGAELVLAADQFIITPDRPRRGRRARARRRRRSADRDRGLSLVHRLGPRHHDQPRRADADHRPLVWRRDGFCEPSRTTFATG